MSEQEPQHAASLEAIKRDFFVEITQLRANLLVTIDRFRERWPNCQINIQHYETEINRMDGQPRTMDQIDISGTPSEKITTAPLY